PAGAGEGTGSRGRWPPRAPAGGIALPAGACSCRAGRLQSVVGVVPGGADWKQRARRPFWSGGFFLENSRPRVSVRPAPGNLSRNGRGGIEGPEHPQPDPGGLTLAAPPVEPGRRRRCPGGVVGALLP